MVLKFSTVDAVVGYGAVGLYWGRVVGYVAVYLYWGRIGVVVR